MYSPFLFIRRDEAVVLLSSAMVRCTDNCASRLIKRAGIYAACEVAV